MDKTVKLSLYFYGLFLFSSSVFAIEIITHNDSGLSLNFKNEENIRAIFSMRQRYWSNSEKIKVFVLADNHVVHKAFAKEKLAIFPHQLRRSWNRMTYTGTGQSPKTVNSVIEMIQKVKQTPYSIGYVDTLVSDDDIKVMGAR